MFKSTVIVCAVLVGIAGTPNSAYADWLLTGFFGPITGVKTSESEVVGAPDESYDSSVGFGVNLASAFPNRGNLGFELDWAVYPSGLKTSSEFDTFFASKLMSISTNFFYSPSIPRVRPYFTVGPNFSYRSDHEESSAEIDSGWAVGINGGGGVMVFANERFGGRVDLRYYRNFGDFYNLRTDVEGTRSSGWNNLKFFRIFFGGTVVLG